jgi:hypothetical protein
MHLERVNRLVTALQYSNPNSSNYAPGKAGPSYNPTIRIHPKGRRGKPDSTGCVTASPDWVDTITALMNRNINAGGTILKVYNWKGVPWALPPN